MIWKKSEIDYGRFHEGLSWSPNGSKIAYTKYHYSNNNQSLVYDIKIYDKQIKTLRAKIKNSDKIKIKTMAINIIV